MLRLDSTCHANVEAAAAPCNQRHHGNSNELPCSVSIGVAARGMEALDTSPCRLRISLIGPCARTACKAADPVAQSRCASGRGRYPSTAFPVLSAP